MVWFQIISSGGVRVGTTRVGTIHAHSRASRTTIEKLRCFTRAIGGWEARKDGITMMTVANHPNLQNQPPRRPWMMTTKTLGGWSPSTPKTMWMSSSHNDHNNNKKNNNQPWWDDMVSVRASPTRSFEMSRFPLPPIQSSWDSRFPTWQFSTLRSLLPQQQQQHLSRRRPVLYPVYGYINSITQCCYYSQSTATRTTKSAAAGLAPTNSGSNKSNNERIMTSVRSQFNNLPIQQSILQYIQRIGVGIPERNNNPHRHRRSRQRPRSGQKTMTTTPTSKTVFLMSQEEEERRLGMGLRRSPTPSFPPPPFGGGWGTKKQQQQSQQQQQQQQQQRQHHPNGRPKTTPRDNQRSGRGTAATTPIQGGGGRGGSKGGIVEALPVKVLGSVGISPSSTSSSSSSSTSPSRPSSSENMYDAIFPRPSVGIPEVAIAGRSNVGKSTLLNALLYGGRTDTTSSSNNEMEETSSLKQNNRRRRKSSVTSQTAKLPPGVKAATSSKPGETRRITFYQLSANVYGDDEDEDDNNEGDADNTPSNISNNHTLVDTGDKGGERNRRSSTDRRRHFGDKKRNDTTKQQNTKKPIKKSLLLVDLPGYGFAYGPTASSVRAKGGDEESSLSSSSSSSLTPPWQSLTERYILERPRSSLKRILLLIDARHGMKRADVEFLESLQNGLRLANAVQRQDKDREYDQDGSHNGNDQSPITGSIAGNTRKSPNTLPPRHNNTLPPIQIVLTKCDMVSQVDLARRVLVVRQQLSDCLRRQPSSLPEMFVSAQMEGQAGVLELQKELASMVLPSR